MLERNIKILLAIILFTCLVPLSEGLIELLHFLSMCGFALLTYIEIEKNRNIQAILFAMMALLFQPFLPVTLTPLIWIIIDIVGAVWLIILTIMKSTTSKEE